MLSWEFIVSTVDDSNLLYPPKVTPYAHISISIKISINFPSDHFFWAISFQLSSSLSITFIISTQTSALCGFWWKTYFHSKQRATLHPFLKFALAFTFFTTQFYNFNFHLTLTFFCITSSVPALTCLSFFCILPPFATSKPMHTSSSSCLLCCFPLSSF